MSNADAGYGLKKDVRNNQIVREVDHQQRQTFVRTLLVTGLAVGMLLFSAWQHFAVLQHSYEIGALQQQLAIEQVLNRRLHLEVEALRSPARIEQIATNDLHMIAPSQNDSVVIERIDSQRADPASSTVPGAQTHAAIVASVR